MNATPLRNHLARLLHWPDAHATFERVVERVPPELRGVRPDRLPHSMWELLEHMRLTQRDILDFCRDPGYVEPEWPADYWPGGPEPPTSAAWQESIDAFLIDRSDLMRLAEDEATDLFAIIPHGSGQTYLREVLLVADHSAHHLGQMILVRRLLGIWEPHDPHAIAPTPE